MKKGAEVDSLLLQSLSIRQPSLPHPPLLPHSPIHVHSLLSSSLEESDPSDLSLPATPPALPHHRSRAYSYENSMERPSTALPSAFRVTPRRASRTEHHRCTVNALLVCSKISLYHPSSSPPVPHSHSRRRPPPPSHRRHPDPWKGSASSATITTSGDDEEEEEEEKERSMAERQGPITTGNGPHIGELEAGL